MDLLLLNTTKFLKTGDRQAFEWLYLRSEKGFIRYARKLTAGRYAQDLIQLTCLQVLEFDGTAKDPAQFNFSGFFCRAMHNTLINDWRKKRVRTAELFEELSPADELYEERNFKPLLLHVEKYLSPTQKQIIYFRMKGIKYRHIAIIMGINVNTARGVFRYAQKILVQHEKKILEL